jgi:hypothetical protein
MPQTKANYRPVSNGVEAAAVGFDEGDVVIFTIDDDETDNDTGHLRTNGELSVDSVFKDSPTLNNERVAFEMEDVNRMDISAYSLSDDDLSEQLFGWKDPWLPSILISLTLTTPICWAMHSCFIP